MSLSDAEDYVMAMLAVKPRYRGSVPLWVTLMLQTYRDQGATMAELARRFGVRTSTVQLWWSEQRFEPLSGREWGTLA